MVLEETGTGGQLCNIGHLGVIFIGEDAIHLVTPECTDRITYLSHCGVGAVCKGIGNVVFPFKSQHAVVVEGGVQAKVVAKIVADIVGPFEGELNAGVEHLAVVCKQGGYTAAGGNRSVENNAVGDAVIEINVTCQAAAKECEVGTDVGLGDYLPAQVILIYRLCADAIHQSVTKHCGGCNSGGAGNVDVVGRDIVVTQHTPAGAEFQVIEGLLALHERFVRNDPAQTDGGEEAPFLLILGAAVGTEGDGGQVAVLVTVGATGEERETVVAACAIGGSLVLVGAVHQIAGLIVIVGDEASRCTAYAGTGPPLR